VVAGHDGGAGADAGADGDPGKELPVLPGVEVSEQVLQVPLPHELVALGVEHEWRGDLRVEVAAIVQGVGVEVDELARHLVVVVSAVASHLGGLA
jgi:hypothetical protein